MKIAQFFLWLLVSAVEILFIGNQSAHCPDMDNYLVHPGVSELGFQADSLIYYILHLSGSNSAWIAGILIASVAIYNLACLSTDTGNVKKLILISAPFSLSILAAHFWSCAIRSGLSISVLILAISMILQKVSTGQSNALIGVVEQGPNITIRKWLPESLLLALSVALHWATSIIIAFLIITLLLRDVGSKFPRLLNGRVHIKLSIAIALSGALGFGAYLYIIDKLLNYEITGSVEYGRAFPILSAYMAFIVLTSLPAKRLNWINEYNMYLSTMLLVLSFLSFLGLSGNLIRLLAPFSLIMMYSFVLGSRNISRLLLCTLACSPPFLYYAINTYFKVNL